jgi:hypothetical protein
MSDTRVELAKYRGKETTTLLLDADNMSVRAEPDGGLVLELFRYGANDRAIESYRFHISAEDRRRVKQIA